VRDVLARYTEWTGRARMLPRWALEYGDADCYNDGDNVKKPGTVPKGWSDGPTGKTPDVIETVARKYREHDMPGGWILPNDGYGCGYTALPETVQGLAKYGFRTGLWTENGVEKMAWEVGTAGTRVQKLDVAWTGKGYQFSLDANKSAYDGILNNSDGRLHLDRDGLGRYPALRRDVDGRPERQLGLHPLACAYPDRFRPVRPGVCHGRRRCHLWRQSGNLYA
jgi:hypothetical protein